MGLKERKVGKVKKGMGRNERWERGQRRGSIARPEEKRKREGNGERGDGGGLEGGEDGSSGGGGEWLAEDGIERRGLRRGAAEGGEDC